MSSPTSSPQSSSDPSDVRKHQPLKPLDLQLLLALTEGDRHGYGLARVIAARTDGVLTLEPGNLYRVLKRLLADGLLAEAERRPAEDLEDERRRYYRLTPLGGRVLAAELRRLRSLVESPEARELMLRWAP